MHLMSVNTGKARPISAKGGETGIFKQAADGPVSISADGLAGDTIVDVENHGGVDQAVYVYGWPDYVWWSQALGRDLPAGTFGENLTVAGLESLPLCVGDRLQVGAVLLEVTSPRIPCVTLAARMGDPQFVKRFAKAERFGPYCRVITPGSVQAGDAVTLHPYTGDRLTLVEFARLFFAGKSTPAQIRRILALPVAVRDRAYYTAMLAEVTSPPAQ
jgi:MOSC domain-containing protein YiiM